MLAFLEGVDEPRFDRYQAAMRDFLASPDAVRFTNAHWCDTLARTILSDLPARDDKPAPASIIS
jgi:alpha(1,3/1,4) fucosyltransferase